MPVGEIIRYICISGSLVYKVEEKAVIIATSDMIINDMQSDFYYISGGLIEIVNTDKKKEGLEELFKDYFMRLGITFPKGSSILYLKNSSFLYIRNTKQNQQNNIEISN